MSLHNTLAALARGERPGDALLGTCRCEWRGGEAYGEEAILALFRAAPLALVAGEFDTKLGTLLESDGGAAWFGDRPALFADLQDGRITRLWRLGAGTGATVEPSIAVALDPDLRQARGDLLFRREDHPALDRATAEAVEAAGRALLATPGEAPSLRARAFVVRAFGREGEGAALFAVYRLSADPVRAAGFAYAAARLGAAPTLVIDTPPPRPWRTRL